MFLFLRDGLFNIRYLLPALGDHALAQKLRPFEPASTAFLPFSQRPPKPASPTARNAAHPWRNAVASIPPVTIVKTSILCFFVTVISGFALAQTLVPELSPIASKHKADIAALEAQDANALSQAQTRYVAALAAAERVATSSGKVAAVAAIASERTALANGLMAPGLPPDLPRELQMPRKTYLDAVEHIRTAQAPRRQMIDGAYLRALSNLDGRATSNSELARELADEKQKLLASESSTSKSKSNSKNLIVNGTFDAADDQGHPAGWTIAENYKVAREGTNAIVHASAEVPVYQAITQDIQVPPRVRNVIVRARVRGKIMARDAAKSQGPPGFFVSCVYIDKNEKPSSNWIMLDAGSDAKWKTVTSTSKVPEGMKTLRVGLVLKYVSGEFDYDDVDVEFR